MTTSSRHTLVRFALIVLLLAVAACEGGRTGTEVGGNGDEVDDGGTDGTGSDGGDTGDGGGTDGAQGGGQGETIASVTEQSASFGFTFAQQPPALAGEQVGPLLIERNYRHAGLNAERVTVRVTNTGNAVVTELVVEITFNGTRVTLPSSAGDAAAGEAAEPVPDTLEVPAELAPQGGDPAVGGAPAPAQPGATAAQAREAAEAAGEATGAAPQRREASVGELVAAVGASAGTCATSDMAGASATARCALAELPPGASVEVVVRFVDAPASGIMPITVAVQARP